MESKASNVSTEQLMHFVDKEEYLIQILNHNFYPRICCENALKPLFKTDVYIPMKCFCDIPLRYIGNHMDIYGQYGIGFSKQWGVKTGLSPVVYFNERSNYIKNIKKVFNNFIERYNDNNEDTEIVDMISILKSSFAMYKPIDGELKHGEEIRTNYHFYNEREWRLLLSEDNSSYLQCDNLPKNILDRYNGTEKDGEWVKGILQLENQIKFTYDDIDFVIIPADCNRNKIIEELTASKCEIEKIKKKINTLEELKKLERFSE